MENIKNQISLFLQNSNILARLQKLEMFASQASPKIEQNITDISSAVSIIKDEQTKLSNTITDLRNTTNTSNTALQNASTAYKLGADAMNQSTLSLNKALSVSTIATNATNIANEGIAKAKTALDNANAGMTKATNALDKANLIIPNISNNVNTIKTEFVGIIDDITSKIESNNKNLADLVEDIRVAKAHWYNPIEVAHQSIQGIGRILNLLKNSVGIFNVINTRMSGIKTKLQTL